MALHARLEAAAAGTLPEWSHPSAPRRTHIERVAALLDEWAVALDLADIDRKRWRAAGMLHDALREVAPDELRPMVEEEELRDVAGKLLHGPAAAARLRSDGVHDEPLLRAITYHTIGHPQLDELGRALFIADFIEPGRLHDAAHLAVLRARMPHARTDVLRDVLRARIGRLLHDNRPIRAETAAFWNVVSGELHGGAA